MKVFEKAFTSADAAISSGQHAVCGEVSVLWHRLQALLSFSFGTGSREHKILPGHPLVDHYIFFLELSDLIQGV